MIKKKSNIYVIYTLGADVEQQKLRNIYGENTKDLTRSSRSLPTGLKIGAPLLLQVCTLIKQKCAV